MCRFGAVLEIAGRILAVGLMVVAVAAITAADIYVLVRYGVIVWLFALPVALGLASTPCGRVRGAEVL